MRLARPCMQCGAPTTNGTYCHIHAASATRTSKSKIAERAREKARDPNRYGPGWAAKSKRVIARDGGICWICGLPGATTADHVIPRARGGSNDETNLMAAHVSCNARKGAK